MAGEYPEIKVVPKHRRFRLVRWLRNRLLAGLITALPIIAVVWVITTIVGFVDSVVWGLLPDALNPSSYVDFNFWGFSLLLGMIGLILLGVFVSNAIGRRVLRGIEGLLARVPVVSSIYNGLKQIIQTIASQEDRAFQDVCLIEYPRKGVWAVGFVTADLTGAPEKHLGKDFVCVFVPTTPNPTSGFLLFVPRDEITLLDMTPEEGAKLIISGGMVTSNDALEPFDPIDALVPLTDETLNNAP